jgi:alkylation response protein AidB-like acyl-CoA dehydrogenase
MSAAELLLAPAARAQIDAFFEPRAPAVDAGQASVQEGIAFLHRHHFRVWEGWDEPAASPNDDLVRVAETIATVAWSDMSSAFSLWCHRMVLDYLACAAPGSWVRRGLMQPLLRAEWLGSTALASAVAHHVAGTPLPISARRDGNRLRLNGRIFWASNLFVPDFVLITATAGPDDARPLIVALPGDAPGLRVEPNPSLLALQATGSSSLTLVDVPLEPEAIVTDDFRGFFQRIRSTFLLLQSSFCWGLAGRALCQTHTRLHGVNEIFMPDLADLDGEATRLADAIRSGTRDRRRPLPVPEALQIRLDSARLATAAVALEAKTMGGGGYVVTTPTARRLREAAFLPIQTPTEGQLRWEIAHNREL